jgi:hypothetical protein
VIQWPSVDTARRKQLLRSINGNAPPDAKVATPLKPSKEGPFEERAITRKAALRLRVRQQSLHALAGFFGKLFVEFMHISLDLVSMCFRLLVNVQEIVAKAPTKAAHA